MANPVSFNEQAARVLIKSAPRPVTRINRKALMLGAGLGALALFVAASIALKPPRVAGDPARELYNTTNKRAPDGLSALPASYAEISTDVDRIPRLGPPLPGDLGATVLAAEQDLGIEYEPTPAQFAAFTPNPVDEAARARQLRDAKLSEDAASAPVFFQLQSKPGAEASPRGSGADTSNFSSELFALATAQPAEIGQQSPAGPNLQSRKSASAAEPGSSDIYNPNQIEDPLSPYQVMSGTLIAASLVTGLNSDLPGTVIAQVTQPVFDTVTGSLLLIPQGSRLIGRYQSEISYGQDRALVTWDRIIFPDGSSIVISAPGADAGGYAGLSDRTDHHWNRVFAAAGLATILGIGSEIGAGSEGDIERAVRRGLGDTVSQAGQRVVDRSLGIQPTIKVRPGWPVRVIVTRDLILRPYQTETP